METVVKRNTLLDKIFSEFESSKNLLFGDLKLREQAMESLSRFGIPNRKSEEYKYVNIDLMLKGDFAFASDKFISFTQIEHTKFISDAINIVIVNGVLNEELSNIKKLPIGLQILSIEEANNNGEFQKHYSKHADVTADSFIAMNTSLAIGGVFIHLAKGSIIETPIHVINISSAKENTIINSRNLIVIEENAQATFIESFQTIDSSAKTFTNALSEIVVAEHAIVDYTKFQNENEHGYLVNTLQVSQHAQSVFTTNTITLSGSLVRNNLNIVLYGEHIETHLNGLYLTNGNQVVDNHTLVDHRKPNCNSNELYKGIIEDESSATFNGKIFVRKDAQKTNAFQSNKNILLSDDGTINTKPQLEIYADDVKCSHGTSTGKLDADKIFYLRARGLSELSAKKLLMHAFASEVVDAIKLDSLREYIEEQISKRFE